MKKIINKLSKIFENKKRRYLYTFLFMLPILVIIGLLSFGIYKDAKSLLSLVTNDGMVSSDHIINNGEYVLRDNNTDYQYQIFSELKDMLEGKVEYDDKDLASSIVKNYVADFYTFSNKAGQYDVGGMWYVYPEQKESIYTKARDGMYKYLNEYINKYGSSELLEVDNVVTTCSKMSDKYEISTEMVSIDVTDEETGEGEYVYWTATDEYDAYKVIANWTYVTGRKFSTAKYDCKMSFIVIDLNGKFVIVEASK